MPEQGESIELKVEGYNSFFKKGENSIRVWLKLDGEKALAATSVKVLDDNQLVAKFNLPTHLPVDTKVHDFSLIVDNEYDGASVLPSAVFVTQNDIDASKGQAIWENAPIENLYTREGMTFPFRNILSETIRNTYYHVPLWFAMFFLFIGSVIYSGMFLNSQKPKYDHWARALCAVGIVYGILGLITGAIWAKHTWGAYWSWDPKQNMAAVAMLVYMAYFVLRNSFDDTERAGRIAAVYNIFAFAALIPLIYIIPRLVDSLHPGAGGNPAMGGEDLDNTMRMVFYPAIIGWTLLGCWISNLLFRMHQLQDYLWFKTLEE